MSHCSSPILQSEELAAPEHPVMPWLQLEHRRPAPGYRLTVELWAFLFLRRTLIA
jgi:hypothetical protein